MENGTFRSANAAEHERILKSEREVFLMRILGILLILFVTFGTLLFFGLKVKSSLKEINHTWEEADYLVGFHETDESIIKELYGDFEEKAESLVWKDKSKFLDKETTAATGEMTYDEAAMEQYKQEVIAELKSQIDYDKVHTLLEERKANYREMRMQELTVTQNAGVGGPEKQKFYLYLVFFLVIAIVAFVLHGVRYKCFLDKNYLIADGVITEKHIQKRGDSFIRRRLSVAYQGGTQTVIITTLQTMRMHEGDRVYLIRTNLPFRPYKACKMD